MSGCNSNTLGLSNLLSYVFESLYLSVSDPFKILSSEDMIAHLEKFNKEIRKQIEHMPEFDWRDGFF